MDDAAETAVNRRACLCQRCHRLRDDPPAPRGDPPVSRSARRTAQRRRVAVPRRRPLIQRGRRAGAQEPLLEALVL